MKSTDVTGNINDDSGTKATLWNTAIINVIIYTCAYPPVTCKDAVY